MKVALCLHGQPRNWKPAVFSFNKYIISRYDTDLFGHTWWAEEQIGNTYNVGIPGMKQKIYTVESNSIKELQNTYTFKKSTDIKKIKK